MPKTYTSTSYDSDGRQLVLSDNILAVSYYDASNESWDKAGASGQGWYNEIYLPSDTFDTPNVLSDRWNVINTAGGQSSLVQNGNLTCSVLKAEGGVGLTSDGKWRFTGDFTATAFLDWSGYTNEYRSNTNLYLKVGYDSSNAARICFSWNGSGFVFRSQKTIGRDIKFFDWKANGSNFPTSSISGAKFYIYLKVVRTAGQVRFYISNGITQSQIGEALSDAVFSNNLYLEFGNETIEYNTTVGGFTKIEVSGTVTPTTTFFSTTRGLTQAFPDKVLLVVDQLALSIIDYEKESLWMRFVFAEAGAIKSNSVRVSMCNGVLYCATPDGLIAVDFPRDRIFKYSSPDIYVSHESIALRNSKQNYILHTQNIGVIPGPVVGAVHCKSRAGRDYVALGTSGGVSVLTHLASGVAYNIQGTTPTGPVVLSDTGSLYWAGYNQSSNMGELSYHSNYTVLPSGTFSRTGYYDINSGVVDLLAPKINSIDVVSVNQTDLLALGGTDGVSFLAFSPGASFTGSRHYGVTSSVNTINDPIFSNYLGIDWLIEANGFQEKFFVRTTGEFSTAGSNSVKLYFDDPQTSTTYYLPSGTYCGVSQVVDFTSINAVYYDIKSVIPVNANVHAWSAQVCVGDSVLKTYRDLDGSVVRLNESVDTSGFSGSHKLLFRLYIDGDVDVNELEKRLFYIANLRTALNTPDAAILPAGQAQVQEVALQYDSVGHKIYFTTSGGFGAIDLDDESLDYFNYIDKLVTGSQINGAEFVNTDES